MERALMYALNNGIEFGMLQAIAAAVMQLIALRDETELWARAIAMMRKRFGGHPYGASEAIVEEGRTGRVGGFVRD
jgi:6-phosphogluconate dehydrogenase (decarboxylating)